MTSKPKAKPKPKPKGRVAEPPSREPQADGLEALAAQVVGAAASDEAPSLLPEVYVDPTRDADVFRVMDALDEAQILDSLEGRPSDVMVYTFQQGGKRVVGLSFHGVAECVRAINAHRFARIRVSDRAPVMREVQETDEKGETVTYIECSVYAEDEQNGGGMWGLARQPKFQTFRDSGRKPELDKFASTKALSKAQRNAMAPLVPVAFREALIAHALGNEKRVKEIRVGMGDPTAEMPPPLVDERATALKGEVRGVYDEIRKGWPRHLPPGQFNVKLRRAEVEHAALEELRDELRSRLDHLKSSGEGA